MTEPWLEVQLIERGTRHFLVGHNEQQSEKLSDARSSTVKVGLVKGKLRELRADQNSQ